MSDLHPRFRPFFALSSILWKLTLFVGVVVALNCAALIGVTYLATRSILQDRTWFKVR